MPAYPDGFHGAALRLTQADVESVAASLHVEPLVIWAVAQVEAGPGDQGFLADGRPNILFEAHIFHQLTGGQWDSEFPNISSPKWDPSLYGAAGAHQYGRLASAIPLDREAALQSASWGLFQILGENYAQVGFAGIDDFVAAMCESEGKHLAAFAAFCTTNNLTRFLQAHDWQDFALGYNGAGAAANNYAQRLADAYNNGTWPPPGLPPGPPPPAPPPPPPGPPPPPSPPPAPPPPAPPPPAPVLVLPVGDPRLVVLEGFDQDGKRMPLPMTGADARSDNETIVTASLTRDGQSIMVDAIGPGQTVVHYVYGTLDRALTVSTEVLTNVVFELSTPPPAPARAALAIPVKRTPAMTALRFLLARLSEASTYGGLGMLVAAFGLHPSDAQLAAIVQFGMAAAGLASVFIPEGK